MARRALNINDSDDDEPSRALKTEGVEAPQTLIS